MVNLVKTRKQHQSFKITPDEKHDDHSENFYSLNNSSEEYLKVLKGAHEYHGFNPKAILKEMIRRKSFLDIKRPEIKWDLTNREEEFRVKNDSEPENILSSNEPLTKDIRSFWCLCSSIATTISVK
ncbi:unnamed protein product [Euphydryas editha]|uniref:Uncharacterized protein n=1 Tax=Euphydryas editha TaxID=104508 RepID=A0AAU9TSG9_EUPED|nr:unnamed protein product [Euphydryas editha]